MQQLRRPSPFRFAESDPLFAVQRISQIRGLFIGDHFVVKALKSRWGRHPIPNIAPPPHRNVHSPCDIPSHDW
jgi:hypothetical protein